MASQPEKIQYLTQLDYEVCQLRHTYARLYTCKEQLDWNAFLELFAVHARLLIEFLCNEADARSYKACDFAEEYRLTRSKSDIHGALTKLDEQIFHLSKNRKTDPSDKVNTARAKRLVEWIEPALRQFEDALDEAYRPHWLALKEASEAPVLKIKPTPPSATNAIQTCTASDTSHMVDLTFKR